MPEIVDISDDADEVMEVEAEQSSMSVNFGELELTLDSTLNITDSSLNSTIEEITVESESDDDDIEIVRESAAAMTSRSGKRKISFAQIDTKCQNCRQSNPQTFHAHDDFENSGTRSVVNDKTVNIVLDDDIEEDGEEGFQYKITDFSIYCKDGEENHLVPVFAENLLITGKKIYLSGKVLRLDQEEDEDGLLVKHIQIIMWYNQTGMDLNHENIIVSAECGSKKLEFNLLKPCKEYLNMFKDVYRMAYLGNRIITKLSEIAEDHMLFEYEELLSFVRGLESPTFYGEKLLQCDDEFFQIHSNFIIDQIRSYDHEEVTISELPCVKHMCRLNGGKGISRSRSAKRPKNTPQPTTLNTKSQTTPLVSELFDSIFNQQMKRNQAAKNKLCTCSNCQKNNCGNCDRCREMISFGGKKPDSKVVCLDRQCLKNLEVFLDDDLQEKKKRILAGVRWSGEPIKTKGRRTYYEMATLQLGPREKEQEVVPGACLLITPDEEEHQSVPHYPCRVLSLFTMIWQGKVRNMAHVQWFARGENTILGRTSDTREWFLVEECEEVVLESVSRILDIEYLPVSNFDNWRKQGGTRAAIMKEDAGGKDGWWRMMYQPEFGRFPFPDKDNIQIKGPGQCYLCDMGNKENEDKEVIVGEDAKSVRIKGVWYFVGQLLMVTDTTIPFKIPAKVPKSYPKPKVDPELYPEHWRKPTVYESDHVDTWQPFQVVRMEQVVKTRSEFFIRVRKLYRPHDTHLSHEEARTKPYSLLHWSEEICRMYPRVVAVRNNRISMDEVVGKCYVRPLENIRTMEELEKWTDEGEDRFFVDKMYNADRKTFEPLQAHVINELNQALSLLPAPVLEEVSALNTMDIFAGCGGLSTGLGQAGVAKPKWAIEFWKPSADAYRKNNPGVKVYNQECNSLLQQAMTDSSESDGIPKKGEVDLLVGGPPCQGFSILNNNSDSEYSKFKNSLVATYLSYCDFYRPKYFILENVRNLVQNENGMVLKLIMASLVKMGYSVGFQVLQAGHYGVAQTRRRLIVLAAAPGQRLPLYPEPTNTFAGAHFLEVEVDGRKYSPTCKRPGAPRRALTVWDAIGDLPAIRSGHDDSSIKYGGEPKSHLQRMFRVNNGDSVEDHISKTVNSVAQERMNRIPTTPGSDWRDLPNISALAEDGRMAKKLNYRYCKDDGSKGVCSCFMAEGSRANYCDQDDRQSDTLIPWSAGHTAANHNNWKEVYGRAPWDGYFKTTITDPKPLGKQGQVLHPEQNRILSVRELARSQGFPDSFKFSGTIADKHKEIGNAVPPPMGRALGLEIRKAMLRI